MGFKVRYDTRILTVGITVASQTRKLEKAAQGEAQCEVSAYARTVVDAASRTIGKTRHGEQKIANISVNCQRI